MRHDSMRLNRERGADAARYDKQDLSRPPQKPHAGVKLSAISNFMVERKSTNHSASFYPSLVALICHYEGPHAMRICVAACGECLYSVRLSLARSSDPQRSRPSY